MTPPHAQNFFSLAHLRPSKRLHKFCYKNEGFEQNVTKCCMLSWKQEWMVHTDKCCTCSWLKWSSSRRKQSTGGHKGIKMYSPFHKTTLSFIHSLVREIDAESFSLTARVSLLVFQVWNMWTTDWQGASLSGLNVQIFGKLSLLMCVKFLNCSDDCYRRPKTTGPHFQKY